MTPATPVMVKSGRNATTMIMVEKIIGVPISPMASVMRVLSGRRTSARWRWMFSTTITVESTMIPKSTAPSEIRFAGVCVTTMPVNEQSSASGMLIAATQAARASPRNSQSTRLTRSIPSTRFSSTVSVVSLVRLPRS